MKTRNKKQSNKNNQIQKVLLRSAAVIISFVLISFTVSAQGFWKQILTNNSFGEMALLMVQESEAAQTPEVIETETSSKATYFFIEQATDESLELENWMTNEAYFGAFNEVLQLEVEPALEVEGWMKSDNHFNNYNTQDMDKSLAIEAWMVDEGYWTL